VKASMIMNLARAKIAPANCVVSKLGLPLSVLFFGGAFVTGTLFVLRFIKKAWHGRCGFTLGLFLDQQMPSETNRTDFKAISTVVLVRAASQRFE